MNWTKEQRLVALSILEAFEDLGGGRAKLTDATRHDALFVVLGRLTAALTDDEQRRLDAVVFPEAEEDA